MAHLDDTKMVSHNTHHDSKGSGYGRFVAMIGTSTVVMYGLMYLNTYALDHVFFSQTRMWMALYMGGMMAIIMLAFMLGMYSNRKTNIAIFAGAVIAFAAGIYLVSVAGHGGRCRMDEGDDPAPLHRDPDQRTGKHLRPARP